MNLRVATGLPSFQGCTCLVSSHPAVSRSEAKDTSMDPQGGARRACGDAWRPTGFMNIHSRREDDKTKGK